MQASVGRLERAACVAALVSSDIRVQRGELRVGGDCALRAARGALALAARARGRAGDARTIRDRGRARDGRAARGRLGNRTGYCRRRSCGGGFGCSYCRRHHAGRATAAGRAAGGGRACEDVFLRPYNKNQHEYHLSDNKKVPCTYRPESRVWSCTRATWARQPGRGPTRRCCSARSGSSRSSVSRPSCTRSRFLRTRLGAWARPPASCLSRRSHGNGRASDRCSAVRIHSGPGWAAMSASNVRIAIERRTQPHAQMQPAAGQAGIAAGTSYWISRFQGVLNRDQSGRADLRTWARTHLYRTEKTARLSGVTLLISDCQSGISEGNDTETRVPTS